MAVTGHIFAGDIVGVFRDDAHVISIGRTVMRCQCCTFWMIGLVVMTNMLYQNIGRVVGGTLLAIARHGLFFIPLVLILPKFLAQPVWGVYLAQPASDLCSVITALPLAVKMYRELRSMESRLPDVSSQTAV